MSGTRESTTAGGWTREARAHAVGRSAALGRIAQAGAAHARARGQARCWVAIPEGARNVRLCQVQCEEGQWLADQLRNEAGAEEDPKALGTVIAAIERACEAHAIGVAARTTVRRIEAVFDGSGDEGAFEELWASAGGGAEVTLETMEDIPALECSYEERSAVHRIASKPFEEGFALIAMACADREGSEGWENGMGGRQTMQWEIAPDGSWTVSESLAYWELGEPSVHEVRSERAPEHDAA